MFDIAVTFRGPIGLLAFTLFVALALPMDTRADQSVYADSRQNGWLDWGWATINYNNPSPVHGGSASISVTSSNWEALYLHHNAQDGSQFSSLRFWIHGGSSGGQVVQVQATRATAPQTAFVLAALPANAWRQETVSLASLGVATAIDFDGFWLQVQNPGLAPTFYVDDITLITNSASPVTVTLTSPPGGSSYFAPATIPLAANVSSNGHVINKVQFYNNTTLLGEDTSQPYTYSLTNVGVGSYNLTARVIFDSGSASAGTNFSAAASVSVIAYSLNPITVNALLNQRPINPLIYGVAFATSNQLTELNATLNRSGGNAETRYNWQLNAHNRAGDWYFQSIGDGSSTPGAESDNHVTQSRNGGAAPILTVPMIEWMPKLGPGRGKLSSYSIAKYGPQTGNDSQYFADAGNGISVTNNTPITWNDPTDANFPTNSAFQEQWIKHLTNRWGLSTNGGVRYYCMDNEHALWNSTHRDVHPVGTTMQEIRDKLFDYGAMVKAIDPDALLLAPEEWGWPGYLYSGIDWQWAGEHSDWNPAHFADRAANGGMDYGPWLLNQARQYELTNGQRLLDVFTLHIYPQGANESGSDVSTATQNGRNRSTRALWDTNYVDQSWINSVIKLIPRMRDWVATYYPGTKIGVTEYNWGAENHINGATAQADILGIFGREGLDYATRWTTPASSTPTFKAMKMYRNYDGNKSTFGDTSVTASGPNPDTIATFAARRSSDGALTLMVINKQLTIAAPVAITLTNYLPAGTAQVWQLTSANAINHLSDITFTGGTFSNALPAQSVTLFIVAPGAAPMLRDASLAAADSFSFWLEGVTGQRYAIQGSSNFVDWEAVQTNMLAGGALQITLPATNTQRFFRAQWLP